MKSLFLLLATLYLFSIPVHAQKVDRESPRPELAGNLDVNDPSSYYQHGVSILTRAPQSAADAFYWASRIDPAWADPLYARRIALLMADQRLFLRYLEGHRRTLQSEEVQQIDSLYGRALWINRFCSRSSTKMPSPTF